MQQTQRLVGWNTIGRPTEVDDIVGQFSFTRAANQWVEDDSYPEALLFVGPPGNGKTSAARVLGLKMLGEAAFKSDFYEYNASDDRGIDFVRASLKQAAMTAPYIGERKVILLDEADGLTAAAQDAMKQIVESNTENCLFIFTANDMSKIRPAIRSRCAVYNFKPITPEEGSKHLLSVCEKAMVSPEIIQGWSEDFSRLIHLKNGDLRACVNLLEALPEYTHALAEKIGEEKEESKAALAAVSSQFIDMRVQFHEAVSRGRDRMFVMKSFYRNLSSFFEFEPDNENIWIVMRVYGEMMENIYEWPDTDIAFLDYFVAKLKGELENE